MSAPSEERTRQYHEMTRLRGEVVSLNLEKERLGDVVVQLEATVEELKAWIRLHPCATKFLGVHCSKCEQLGVGP